MRNVHSSEIKGDRQRDGTEYAPTRAATSGRKELGETRMEIPATTGVDGRFSGAIAFSCDNPQNSAVRVRLVSPEAGLDPGAAGEGAGVARTEEGVGPVTDGAGAQFQRT